jgi:hypothetical protein
MAMKQREINEVTKLGTTVGILMSIAILFGCGAGLFLGWVFWRS